MALISTTLGEIDEAFLEKKVGTLDNDHECTNWTEYWKDGELVHRSVHVHLKQGLFGGADAASF